MIGMMGSEERRGYDQLNAEYRAKGWPLIDPRSSEYCYQPCRLGLHVCGQHPDGDNCMSVANFPTTNIESAVALFEQAKAELSEPDETESDFIVDLVINDNIEHDFRMNRQMLVRLTALAQTFTRGLTGFSVEHRIVTQ